MQRQLFKQSQNQASRVLAVVDGALSASFDGSVRLNGLSLYQGLGFGVQATKYLRDRRFIE